MSPAPRLLLAVLLGLLMLTGCGPKEPITLGFISGQTGRFADLGNSGLNGAILAVDQRNARGGIKGQSVSLLVRDDAHDPEQAGRLLEELLQKDVLAVIGPMTSAMATALTPIANRHETLLMGGTVVTSQLSNLDDQFVRAIGSTRDYAADSARKIHQQLPRLRQVSILFDEANREYSEDWAREYANVLRSQGVASRLQPFNSGIDTDPEQTSLQALEDHPDLVTLVCSSASASALAKTLHKQQPQLRLNVSGWGGTAQLLQLGGPAVEGMLVEQYFSLGDESAPYLDFVRAYRERFKLEPDFGSVIAFDATNIVLDTLAQHPQRRGLKDALIARGEFQGLQGVLRINRYGDSDRLASLAEVRNKRFVPLP